jgi:hypothetical protein
MGHPQSAVDLGYEPYIKFVFALICYDYECLSCAFSHSGCPPIATFNLTLYTQLAYINPHESHIHRIASV